MGKHKTSPETEPVEAAGAHDEVAAALEAEFEAELAKKAKQHASPDDAEASTADLPEDVETHLRELEQERDDAIAAKQRAQADFLNYQRRATENECRAVREGTCNVVRSIMPVIDLVDLALDQDREQITLEQLLEGVTMMRQELMKALEGHLVQVIKPEQGEEFDPSRHQAMMRQETDEQPPDTIVSVMQVGYAVEEMILRPAAVSVAAAKEDEPEGD